MDLKGLYPLALSGQQIMVENCNVVITQPKIKNILFFGEDKFFNMVSILGETKKLVERVKEGNPRIDVINDFQIVMTLLEEEDVKDQFDTFCELIFPDYKVAVEDNQIQFFNPENDSMVSMIHPFNFESLEQIIDILFSPNRGQHNNKEEYNPVNDKAKEIANKLKAAKEKVKKIKKEGQVDSIFGTYISSLSVGLGMDMNILFNYTPFQLFDTYERFTSKVQSDFYQKLASTPFIDLGDADAPEDWTRDFYAIYED